MQRTCNESVFSLPLCSSDERSTSLYISTASPNSSAHGKDPRRRRHEHSIPPSHSVTMRRGVQTTYTLYIGLRDAQQVCGDKTNEIMSSFTSALIPMGNAERVGAQGLECGFVPLMMWIPARPLRAHTNCLWASSHSTRHFFWRDLRSSSIVMVLRRGRTRPTDPLSDSISNANHTECLNKHRRKQNAGCDPLRFTT